MKEGVVLTSFTKEELISIFIEASKEFIKPQGSIEKELTQSELIKELRISKPTLIKWQKEGIIPFLRAPGSRTIRYLKSHVVLALQNHAHLDRIHYAHLKSDNKKSY